MKNLINLTSKIGKKLSWIQNFLYALFGTGIVALIGHIKDGTFTVNFVLFFLNTIFLILGLISVTKLIDRHSYYLAEFQKKSSVSGDFRVFYAERQNFWDKIYQILFYIFLLLSTAIFAITLLNDLKNPDKAEELSKALNRIEKDTKLLLDKSDEIKLLVNEKEGLNDSISSLIVILKEQKSVIDSLQRTK
ncbi:hypothetical protein ABV409_12780 [Flagellimonas sp. DF-77]|uniref:hypothetical protein n=1 Tax=Flagellimonas algarum TaxID=3230298 RepID=UPI0033912EEE